MEAKKYTFDEVFAATLKYFNGDELATKVWIEKYSLKDSDGNLYELTPDDMHRRLAKEFARIESKYPNPLSEEEIFAVFKDFKYIIPQGSPMAGIGNNRQVTSLSNCFVIGNFWDSYGGILLTDEIQVQLMKRRGGVGHDLSHIRPSGSRVNNSAITSTGVVPFMERYSNSTKEVAQDGRRGALMLSMSIKHPDSEEFIDAKLEKGKVTGANISVKVTDEFMDAVVSDGDYYQVFPISTRTNMIVYDGDVEYNKLYKSIDGGKQIYFRKIKAKKLWDKIIHNAWKSAEPGILFWDQIKRESVADCYADLGFDTVSTNPCGELPLPPFDSCRLLAVNLYSYVEKPFTSDAVFNADKFKKYVQYAERLMDDMVDLEIEKIDSILQKIDSDIEPNEAKERERLAWTKIRESAVNGRRTGLGITGEGDMLAALGFRYGTREATDYAVKIQRILAINAYKSSCIMAGERGAFPVYDFKRELGNPFITRLSKDDEEFRELLSLYGRRNIALLTIAPTGTVSIETQTTSGIEPAFMIAYRRRKKINDKKTSVVVFVDGDGIEWEEYNVFHHHFETWLTVAGYDVEQVKKLSVEEVNDIIAKSPYYKAMSGDVDWVEKIRMQGLIQEYVDHSISVTVNLPNDVSEEMVAKVYEQGWKSGCKGVTVYREGCRDGVLIAMETPPEVKKEDYFTENHAKKRPKDVECEVIRFMNSSEKWIAFLGFVDGHPYEIFTGVAEEFPIPNYVEIGKVRKVKDNGHGSRYDFMYIDRAGFEQIIIGLNRTFQKEYWNYAKLVSGLLRHRMPLLSLVHLLESMTLDETINTWMNGVIRIAKKQIKEGTIDVKAGYCPNCGGKLHYEEGCLHCASCGLYQKCG